MPVSTDFDEPPAKCCKYCEESTHGVDGPASWRLTLDQDLIDTLKGSFPSWFTSTSTNSGNSILNTTTTTTTPATTTPTITEKNSGNILPTIDGMAEGERPLTHSTTTAPPLIGVTNGLNSPSQISTIESRQSPPKAVVDSSPLQPAMDKNKESLKVKLMVRRPITQLVEQGIMPPLKTSPAIHEQRKQLERAKTGDLLKAKIQQRPDRQELERRHILEYEESHVDPSLAEKQRMLKKARLADQLNSQISHRPGPLELIQKNILHTEEPIERIVKEGLVTFKATSEGLLNRPQHPNSYVTFDEDSQSSEGEPQRNSPARTDVLEAAAASAGIVTVALTIPTSGGAVVVTSAPVLPVTKFHPTLIPASYVPPPPPLPPVIKSEPIQIKTETNNLFAELCQSLVGTVASNSILQPLVPAQSPASLGSTTSSLSPLSSVSSPPAVTTPRLVPSPLQCLLRSDAPGKDKNRKKNKCKPVAKARTIKFHEYKGPPSAQKSSSAALAAEETSYQLLLKQKCMLEYLEKMQKHPSILPANQKPTTIAVAEPNLFIQNYSNHTPPQPSPAPSVSSSIPPSPAPSFTDISASELNKLEKMKVSDLKLLLKRRNLPVSGPKPQLIERLKPFLPLDNSETSASESISGETCDLDAMNSPHHSLSPESEQENMDIQEMDSPPIYIDALGCYVNNDDLLREQRRKIDELQRKLRESQEELEQMKQNQSSLINVEKQEPINQKQIFKQQLEAKIQKEKLQQIENQQRLQKELVVAQQQVLKNQGNLYLATHNQLNNLLVPKEEMNTTCINGNGVVGTNGDTNIFNDNHVQMTNKKNVGIVWNGEPTIMVVQLQDKKIMNGHQRAASMPSIIVPLTASSEPSQTAIIEQSLITQQQNHLMQQQKQQQQQIQQQQQQQQQHQKQQQQEQQQLQQQHLQQQQQNNQPPQIQIDIKPPPPQYEEATKQIENNKKDKLSHIKSQAMTDVLEILIKNGELPASAAHDPSTPNTPGNAMITQEMIFDPSSMSPISGSETGFSESLSSSGLMLNSSPRSMPPLEMLSPIQQQENHIDDSEVKTLDLDFDDLEYMQFSHQFDMDIAKETCHPAFEMHNNIKANSTTSNLNTSTRRNMNPSLQPSLNELIHQSNHANSMTNSYNNNNNNNFNLCSNNNNNINGNLINNNLNHNNNNTSSNNNNNNNNSTSNMHQDTPMDIEDFGNSLSSFDFNLINDVHEDHTQSHPFSLSQQGSYHNSVVDFDTYGQHLAMNQDLFNIDEFPLYNI